MEHLPNTYYIEGYNQCLLDIEKSMNTLLIDLSIHKKKPTRSVIHEWISVQQEWNSDLYMNPDMWVRIYEKDNILEWQLVEGIRDDLQVIKRKPFTYEEIKNKCKRK